MNISTALEDCKSVLTPHYGAGEAKAMCRIIFEDAFQWHRGRNDRLILQEEQVLLKKIENRLLAGEPLQYIMGQADFYGLQFKVNDAVLIPRPETEELVEWILELLAEWPGSPKVLDIGTGSGCIPITIKHHCPQAIVQAVDISEEALAVARYNADKISAEVTFFKVDFLDRSAQQALGQFDVIISNPPYIPRAEEKLMPENVKKHEPTIALFVEDEDPLLFYREIISFALKQLPANGWLYFECNEYNAPQVADLAEAAGFRNSELKKDLQGKWRMWRGRK